jgi:hypothetical protein
MVEVVEEVGVDGCGVRVAVGSEVVTGESCTAELVKPFGAVEKDVALV